MLNIQCIVQGVCDKWLLETFSVYNLFMIYPEFLDENGKVHKDENGKVIKPSNYKPVNLKILF